MRNSEHTSSVDTTRFASPMSSATRNAIEMSFLPRVVRQIREHVTPRVMEMIEYEEYVYSLRAVRASGETIPMRTQTRLLNDARQLRQNAGEVYEIVLDIMNRLEENGYFANLVIDAWTRFSTTGPVRVTDFLGLNRDRIAGNLAETLGLPLSQANRFLDLLADMDIVLIPEDDGPYLKARTSKAPSESISFTAVSPHTMTFLEPDAFVRDGYRRRLPAVIVEIDGRQVANPYGIVVHAIQNNLCHLNRHVRQVRDFGVVPIGGSGATGLVIILVLGILGTVGSAIGCKSEGGLWCDGLYVCSFAALATVALMTGGKVSFSAGGATIEISNADNPENDPIYI